MYIDLYWNELISISAEFIAEKLQDKYINNLNFFQRCDYLNLSLVFIAWHFQCFKVIFYGSVGKVKYYEIKVELQVRGSPHIHSSL